MGVTWGASGSSQLGEVNTPKPMSKQDGSSYIEVLGLALEIEQQAAGFQGAAGQTGSRFPFAWTPSQAEELTCFHVVRLRNKL